MWPLLSFEQPKTALMIVSCFVAVGHGERDSHGGRFLRKAIGGCLSQYDVVRVLRPVASHSASQGRSGITNDKELLRIISSLKAWPAELRSVTAGAPVRR